MVAAQLGAASRAQCAHGADVAQPVPMLPRRVVAARNPDLLAAAGGGCNAILVRGGARILEHRTHERPARRSGA